MTNGPTVFCEFIDLVSKKKISSEIVLILDGKTGINSNNQPKSEGKKISVLRLFQFDELIGKWMSGNQSRTSTLWKALALQDK